MPDRKTERRAARLKTARGIRGSDEARQGDMSVSRYGDSVVDRTGWRYCSRRRGRMWRVGALTPFGWRLWPDWPGHTINTAGGYKSLLRSADDLDDTSKWERVDA